MSNALLVSLVSVTLSRKKMRLIRGAWVDIADLSKGLRGNLSRGGNTVEQGREEFQVDGRGRDGKRCILF